MKHTVLAIFAATACGIASANDLKTWGASSMSAYNECAFAMSTAIMFGDDKHYASTKTCVESKTASVKGQFPAAAAVAGASAERVKDYYAAWISAMQALNSLQYGSGANSERAYQASKQRLSELWTRIEIEAGI